MHERLLNSFREELNSPTSSLTGIGSSPGLNFKIVIPFAALLFPYLAFILILPGIREKRLASFLAVTIHLWVGILIIAALILPYWRVGEAAALMPFRSQSRQRHEVLVGINVGLRHFNVTMRYLRSPDNDAKLYRNLYFNERYDMEGVDAMSGDLQDAYRQGLPYPILRILEYFSVSEGAFAWGREYRNAGHYASSALWTAFSSWILQSFLLMLVPHHYGKLSVICGIFVLLGDFIYVFLSPTDLNIPLPGIETSTSYITLQWGSCFYLSVLAGLLSITFVLSLLQYHRLYTLSTILSSTSLDSTAVPRCQWRNVGPSGKGAEMERGAWVSGEFESSSASISDTTESTDDATLSRVKQLAASSSVATSALPTRTYSNGTFDPTLSISHSAPGGELSLRSLDVLKRKAQENQLKKMHSAPLFPSVQCTNLGDAERAGSGELLIRNEALAPPQPSLPRSSITSLESLNPGDDINRGLEMTDDEDETSIGRHKYLRALRPE